MAAPWKRTSRFQAPCAAAVACIAMAAGAGAGADKTANESTAERALAVASDRDLGDSAAASDARPIADSESSRGAGEIKIPELRQIQQALGGSILQHADALVVEDGAAESEPARQLNGRPRPQLPGPYALPRRPPAPRLFAGAATASLPPDLATQPQEVGALRRSSRELERSANQLEELSLYEQADAMRRLAQRLRLDARRLANAESGGERRQPRLPAATMDAPSEADHWSAQLDRGPIEPSPGEESRMR